jgi:hypothetical protein
MRHAGVVDDEMVDEVKNTMPDEGSDYKSEVLSEAEDGNQQKAACDCAFNDQGAALERMAPQVGLEPTTLRLTAGCSAIELLRSVAPAGRRSVRQLRNHIIWRRLLKTESG